MYFTVYYTSDRERRDFTADYKWSPVVAAAQSVKAQDSEVTTGHSCLLQWQRNRHPVSEQKQPSFQIYLTETVSV